MTGFTDLHQHCLWGIDDGPKTPQGMFELLERAYKDGIDVIAATSHAYPELYKFDYSLYKSRLEEARKYCIGNSLYLRIISGCEIRYSSNVPDLLREGKLPTIGNSRYVLLEFPDNIDFDEIGEASDNMYNAGYTPVIAHVERYDCMIRAPRKAIKIHDKWNLLYQMNCSTVLHPEGFLRKHFVEKLLSEKIIDVVATDAHGVNIRPPHMSRAYDVLCRKYGRTYADRLTSFNIVK